MRDTTIRIEPFFLDGRHGRLFCLWLMPVDGRVVKGLIYLHPFAEEMNKSRRMAALQARALAAGGYAVLQVDLTGCGDSMGDFGDATWAVWLDDITDAYDWMSQRIDAPIGLWGLRIGAALAVQASLGLSVDQLLLWQPVTHGDSFLNQFLRIRQVSELLREGESQAGVQQLRAQLESGEAIEVGGYQLGSQLARGIAEVNLTSCIPPCRTLWLEIVNGNELQLSPAAKQVTEVWRAAAMPLIVTCIPCEPFWITQEIAECPSLIHATLTGLGLE